MRGLNGKVYDNKRWSISTKCTPKETGLDSASRWYTGPRQQRSIWPACSAPPAHVNSNSAYAQNARVATGGENYTDESDDVTRMAEMQPIYPDPNLRGGILRRTGAHEAQQSARARHSQSRRDKRPKARTIPWSAPSTEQTLGSSQFPHGFRASDSSFDL